jgi:hypothetical protein
MVYFELWNQPQEDNVIDRCRHLSHDLIQLVRFCISEFVCQALAMLIYQFSAKLAASAAW